MAAGEYAHSATGTQAHCPQVMQAFLNRDLLGGVAVRTNGFCWAWLYNMTTGVNQTFDLTSAQSNTLEMPLFDPADDHYMLVGFFDKLDRFHVLGNHHDGLSTPSTIRHYVRCDNIAAFTNPTSWVRPTDAEPGAALDEEPSGGHGTGVAGGTYTYNMVDRLTDGRVVWLESQSPARNYAIGRSWNAWIRDSGDWTALLGNNGRLATTATTAPVNTEAQRVYICGLEVEPKPGFDFVHIYGIWRTDNTTADSAQQPFYLYADSRDFTRWHAIDGTTYQAGASGYPSSTPAMPVTWFNRSAATITSAPGRSYINRLGIWLDPATGTSTTPKRPSMLVHNGDAAGGNAIGDPVAHPFLRLYHDGAAWQQENVASLGGEFREFNVNGEHVYRAIGFNAGTLSQCQLRRYNGSGFVAKLGPAVSSRGVGFNAGGYGANPCPVLLRERGEFWTEIGEGNTIEICHHPVRVRA